MKTKLLLTAISAGMLFFTSCEKEETYSSEDDFILKENTTDGSSLMKVLELGDKMEDPYAVTNMEKAYDSLIEQGHLKSKEIEIKATHVYVRFLPDNVSEIDCLWNNSDLILFDYPLNYEIKERGNYYHDPEIPSNKPTWLYTVVPADYQFPDIKHEKLYGCFFPDKVKNNKKLKSISNHSVAQLLENESFRITNGVNSKEGELNKKSNLKGLSWKYPKGQIRVWNTESNGVEGVKHVKVRTQRYTNLGDDWTDDNGNYSIPNAHYKRDVNYSVRFENETGFKIWGEFVFFTTVNYDIGNHSPSGYTKDIWKSYDAWKFASVNNAAYDYRNYCTTHSITKPPSDLRIWVLKKSSGYMGSAPMLRRTWGQYGLTTNSQLANFFLNANGIALSFNWLTSITKYIQPDLTISISDETETNQVDALVFHECGHASHWSKVGSSYWVKYINYIITYGFVGGNGTYGNGTGANAGYCGVGEMWGNYFSAFLIRDHYNYTTSFASDWWWFQEDEYWFNPGFLKDVDAIPNVTTSEIFGCLTSGTITIDKLVTTLKTNIENKTGINHDTQIDDAYNKAIYNDWP